jgi:hypothetical protein
MLFVGLTDLRFSRGATRSLKKIDARAAGGKRW